MELSQNTKIHTCEMHTGGEPLRIVMSGYPEIKGDTLMDKRSYCEKKLDNFRKFLMHEPRGHRGMYGAIIVPPDNETDADFGVLFMHKEGYSVMCGHGTIALGRYAIDHGLIEKTKLKSPETAIKIQCPCGVVKVFVEYDNAKTGSVRFKSVPSFAYAIDYIVEVKGFGVVNVDIGYGGTFYAILPASRLGLNVEQSSMEVLTNAAFAVRDAISKKLKLIHPILNGVEYLYGTILTDGRVGNEPGYPSINFVEFADKAVDRSPCGSGVTARMAVLTHRGLVSPGEKCTFESVIKTKFTSNVVGKTKVGPHNAVIVEILGKANYTGKSMFSVEEDDPLSSGFLLE